MKILKVKWIDTSKQEGPLQLVDALKVVPVKCVSVGFLIGNDEEVLTIAMEYEGEDGNYRDIISIPMVNVKSIEDLVEDAR